MASDHPTLLLRKVTLATGPSQALIHAGEVDTTHPALPPLSQFFHYLVLIGFSLVGVFVFFLIASEPLGFVKG